MPNKKDTMKIINDAFQSDSKRVIALKGGWGIGKTYLWKEIAEKNDKHSVFDICHKILWLFSSKVRAKKEYKIGYVSLFGKKSFDEITQEAILSLYFKNKPRNIFEWLLLKTKSFWFKLFGVSNFQTITQSFSAVFALVGIYSLKNTIICFDDLERMDKNIDFQDFLGFVNDLAEYQECKVVLIFNEDELFKKQNDEIIEDKENNKNTENNIKNINPKQDEATKECIYNKYKEKTIDIEVTYIPTFEDNFEIAYNVTKPNIDEKYILIVKNVLQELNENNIRIIKKCIECINDFMHAVENIKDKINKYNDFSNTILIRIIESITFITHQYWKAGHKFWDSEYTVTYKKEKYNGNFDLILKDTFNTPLSNIFQGKYLETLKNYFQGFNFDENSLLKYLKDYELLSVYYHFEQKRNEFDEMFWSSVSGKFDDYANNMYKLFENKYNAYSFFINISHPALQSYINESTLITKNVTFKNLFLNQMNYAVDRYINEYQNNFDIEYDFEMYRKIELIDSSKVELLYKNPTNADDYNNLLINILRGEYLKSSKYLIDKLEYDKYVELCNENNEFFLNSKSFFFERNKYDIESRIPHFLYITAKYLLETIEINPDNEMKYDELGKHYLNKENYSAKEDLEEYVASYENDNPESK